MIKILVYTNIAVYGAIVALRIGENAYAPMLFVILVMVILIYTEMMKGVHNAYAK